jgi:hypothetical protein
VTHGVPETNVLDEADIVDECLSTERAWVRSGVRCLGVIAQLVERIADTLAVPTWEDGRDDMVAVHVFDIAGGANDALGTGTTLVELIQWVADAHVFDQLATLVKGVRANGAGMCCRRLVGGVGVFQEFVACAKGERTVPAVEHGRMHRTEMLSERGACVAGNRTV